MLLRSRDFSEFELTVLRYEFPEIDDDFDDSNWLVIRVRAKLPDGRSWEATHPSLLTWEVKRLSEWLLAVSNDEPTKPRESFIEFIEPNLSFEVAARSGDPTTLRVYFELELRPSWAFSREAYINDLWVDLKLDRDDLRSAASSLRDELSRFPPRAL